MSELWEGATSIRPDVANVDVDEVATGEVDSELAGDDAATPGISVSAEPEREVRGDEPADGMRTASVGFGVVVGEGASAPTAGGVDAVTFSPGTAGSAAATVANWPPTSSRFSAAGVPAALCSSSRRSPGTATGRLGAE